MKMTAHDLLQISGLADLVYAAWELLPPSPRLRRTVPPSPEKRRPLWVERSLQEAPFVVVRRANLFDGMVPVGVRGSCRQQRFAAYLAPESIRNRITPEQLAANRGWLANARTEEVPGLKVLAGIEEKLANLQLAYGPTGSIGFELASGLPRATSTSDLDLLIRAPERLSMQVARELITIFSGSPCRVDAQLETPRGAVSLAEYASGQTPLLLKRNGGPVLVDDPWELLTE
jgi:phosphoribosyl-dephospho-CoA transferase